MICNKEKAFTSVFSSVTRLGDFFEKKLATKFLVKEAQMIGNFLGSFEKPHSYVKTALANFWATYVKNWAPFNSNIWSHWLSAKFGTQENAEKKVNEKERIRQNHG